MYQVIGPTRTRTFRVLWALEEMGLPYEHLPSPPRSDKVLSQNPTGKVPVLLTQGRGIIDSVAILQFLADKHGLLTFGAGTIERAQQDSFTQFICDELDAALWAAARHTFVLPQDKRLPGLKETLRWEFSRSLDHLVTRMGDGPFLMGDTFTIPDILLTHCGGWARVAKFNPPPEQLKAYFRQMTQRPAYQAADAK